jgi:hypothetical protein
MINHAISISRSDKTITAEIWPFAIQHAATIYTTTKRDHVIMTLARGKNSRANTLNLTKLTCIHYSVQFMSLTDVCKRAHHLLNGQNAQHKRFKSDTFTTIQNQYQWCGTQRQNWSHHNFMTCFIIASTLSKQPIRISNNRTLWTAYLKQTDIHMMIHLGTNTHTYSLTGEQIYTQTI